MGWTRNPIVFLGVFSLWTMPTLAFTDYDEIAEKALSHRADQFSRFTQDKNVMGKAKKPDGSAADGGQKQRFNKDDGVTFVSELTYHKDTDRKTIKKPKQQGQSQQSQGQGQGNQEEEFVSLPEWVSEHGKESAAGGSSLAERTAWQFHEKYSEKEQKEKDLKAEENEEGVQYNSIFKRVTRKAGDPGNLAQGQGQGQGQGNQKEEQPPVFRNFMRDDVKQAFEDVGVQSFQSVKKAAKDPEKQDDPSALEDQVLLYEAYGRAIDAWRNTSLAALGQRRVSKAVGRDARINEEAPSCEEGVNKSMQEAIEKETDPKAKQRLEEEKQKYIKECKQITALNTKEINPRFESDGGNSKERKLVSKGLDKEDGFERDLRNQIEVLDTAGIDKKKLKSNWDYEDKEFKSKITIEYDQNGQPKEEVEWSVQDQFDSYNEQLKAADDSFKEAQSKLGNFPIEAPNAQQFNLEVKEGQSAKDVSRLSPVIYAEEFGPAALNAREKENQEPAQTYDELLKQNEN